MVPKEKFPLSFRHSCRDSHFGRRVHLCKGQHKFVAVTVAGNMNHTRSRLLIACWPASVEFCRAIEQSTMELPSDGLIAFPARRVCTFLYVQWIKYIITLSTMHQMMRCPMGVVLVCRTAVQMWVRTLLRRLQTDPYYAGALSPRIHVQLGSSMRGRGFRVRFHVKLGVAAKDYGHQFMIHKGVPG